MQDRFAWVIGYDTIYAHQDREDDSVDRHQINRIVIWRAYASDAGKFLCRRSYPDHVAGHGRRRMVFTFGVIAFAAHLAWQVTRIDIDDPAYCLMLFKSNRDAGLILFGAMLIDAAI